MDNLSEVMNRYAAEGINLMPLKADYMAERSIPDNIT